MTDKNIHETAIVAPEAKLGSDVKIGPYCVIGENVSLGDRVEIKSHVVVEGHTEIGEDTVIYPFASIGHAPQDLKYKGEDTKLVIGKRNRIREHVTMNPGTGEDKGETVIGDDCLFMMGAHVAHDCIVGNQVILANNATLAGHVHIGNYVILGGLSAVHQFVRIGDYAFIGGMSGVEHDVIPYGLVKGDRAYLAGLNYVGLERRGFDKDQITLLLKAFRELFKGNGTLAERIAAVAQENANDDFVMTMVNFIQSRENRALCLPR